jgi:hypothetical protein
VLYRYWIAKFEQIAVVLRYLFSKILWNCGYSGAIALLCSGIWTKRYFPRSSIDLLLVFNFPFLRYWHRKSGWKINTRRHNKRLKSGNVWKSYCVNLLAVFGIWIPCFVFYIWCRYGRAQLALQKGEEDLAREALKRRKSYAVRTHFVQFFLLNV